MLRLNQEGSVFLSPRLKIESYTPLFAISKASHAVYIFFRMSGVEVAGLVLGSIPLVVAALEHYAEGVESIKKGWRYRLELQSLANDLEAEYGRFLLTCERLLRDIVSEEELELLMKDPGGPRWKDTELENKLRKRLQFSYATYLKCIDDMARTLREIQTKLKLDHDWKVCWYPYVAYLIQPSKRIKRV